MPQFITRLTISDPAYAPCVRCRKVVLTMLVKIYGNSTGNKGHEKKHSPAECIGTHKEAITKNKTDKGWTKVNVASDALFNL